MSKINNEQFPRTEVAGVSMPRMIIGTNWLLGWSHKSPAADAQIKSAYQRPEDFLPVFEAYLSRGVDAVMGVLQEKRFESALDYTQETLGRKLIIIDTPVLNLEDSPAARAECEAYFKWSASKGTTFCLLHHSCAEKLVNKGSESIERLDDYTRMIRDAGMLPGLSCHMPELVLYSDQRGYDVETYIQIYNPMGFLMQVEIEGVARIINHAKKPVMTIKPMAAGRCTPYVGLNFVYNTIRPCDMVTVGVSNAREALEDMEIAMAAIERRWPDLEGRASPAKQAALGN
ncbi:MAG: hypothetical protein FWF05_06620 [Oscillospiraceae bacterium]|nr:hypothetical protein [Oscillospiraceae bacterium]